MSSIIYNKAFDVNLSHDFYVYTMPDSPVGNEFQVNKGFEIFPVDASTDLMRRGRMRFVRTLKGFTVFYQAYLDENEDQQPLVPLSGDKEFVFTIRVKDNVDEFLNITDLNQGGTFNSGNIFLLDAVAANTVNGTLAMTPIIIDQLRPHLFTYSFRSSVSGYTGNADVFVKDENNTALFSVTNVPYNSTAGIYNAGLDLSSYPNGVYKIEAKKSVAGFETISTATIYVDNDLASQNIFSILRVRYPSAAVNHLYDTTSDPADFKTFAYEFEKRFTKWRYFVSIKSDPETFFTTGLRHLQIIDTAGDYTFDPMDGEGEPSPTYKVGQNFATVIFTSDDPIPFSEKSIKTIQLQKADNGGTTGNMEVLISTLPNAARKNVNTNAFDPTDFNNSYAEIFIFIEAVGT
jgi:hypothetical protein